MVAMGTSSSNWNPASASAWESALGLVRVPLFGDDRGAVPPGGWDVLLDGQRSSFVLCLADDDGASQDTGVSWSWSSHVRHLVALDKRRKEMSVRWWDAPGASRRLQWPKDVQEAEWLLAEFDRADPPRAADVILHVLQAFRYIRGSLPSHDGLEAVRVLNALLTGVGFVRDHKLTEEEWLRCQTMADALTALGHDAMKGVGLDRAPAGSGTIPISDLLSSLVGPQPRTGLRLDPYLLLRHAAGDLYQEAHLVIEQESPQLHLAGMVPTGRQQGVVRLRDVRFTPVTLARALVQQALDAYGNRLTSASSLDVLDPACGSGVFLQETLRELRKRGFRGRLTLRGFDLSEISVAMAQFCLAQAKRDVQSSLLAVTIDIRKTDALFEDWGSPDLVLMNPPFGSWRGMSAREQSVVRQVMGTLTRGRPDKAMAFISRGMESLPDGSVMASVLPAPVLESTSGEPWREAIAESADLHLLGRFQGYSYFRGAIVEPGFVVLRRRFRGGTAASRPITVLLADEHAEDVAIRALRKPESATGKHYQLAEVAQDVISPSSWLPRSAQSLSLIERMSNAGVPTVGQLFDVRQGALTGKNEAFVLSREEMNDLPPSEWDFFRPLGHNAAIHDGRLWPGRFVF